MCHFLAMQECLPSLKRARAKNENNSDSKPKRWRGENNNQRQLSCVTCTDGQACVASRHGPTGQCDHVLGDRKNSVEFSILDLLLEEGDLENCATPSPTGGFDVIPANGDLTAAEVELIDVDGKEKRLKEGLAKGEHRYDFVLIDCPRHLTC